MSLNEKRIAAVKCLGTNWVLHPKSTYDAKRREHYRMCLTLRPVVHKAILEGRL